MDSHRLAQLQSEGIFTAAKNLPVTFAMLGTGFFKPPNPPRP